AQQLTEQNNWKPKKFASDAIAELERYAWPGNIRELRNVIERGLLLATGDTGEAATVERALPRMGGGGAGGVASVTLSESAAMGSGTLAQRVEAFERETVLAELKRNHHHMTNTAKTLGLERS